MQMYTQAYLLAPTCSFSKSFDTFLVTNSISRAYLNVTSRFWAMLFEYTHHMFEASPLATWNGWSHGNRHDSNDSRFVCILPCQTHWKQQARTLQITSDPFSRRMLQRVKPSNRALSHCPLCIGTTLWCGSSCGWLPHSSSASRRSGYFYGTPSPMWR